MKLEIKFDWAFVTSVFTIFLYWCGYWYNYGYLNYFNYNIDAFDMPISILLLKGLLISVENFFYLVIVFLLFSFISSLSLNGWKYILSRFLIRYVFNFVFILILLKKSYLDVRNKQNYIDANFLKKLKVISDEIDIHVQNKLFINKLTNNQIVDELNQNENLSLSVGYFQTSFLFHYFLLLFLLVGFLKLFNVGSTLINAGNADAEKSYFVTVKNRSEDKNKFSEIKLKNNKSKVTLYKTDFCMKGECLIVDEEKNSQVLSTKDFEVIFNKK